MSIGLYCETKDSASAAQMVLSVSTKPTYKHISFVSSKGSLCQDGSVEILQSSNGPSVQELLTILTTMDHSQDDSWSWISGNLRIFKNIWQHLATPGNIWQWQHPRLFEKKTEFKLIAGGED